MASCSITKGNGNINHNKRSNEKKLDNVDYDRTPNNIAYIDKDIREVYHDIFDDSIDKYNAKQKRKDRKIDDYYLKVKHDKKTKNFQELVVQVGNKDNPLENEMAEKIYKEFVDEFIKNNPQMIVFGAYVHIDEATPHLHLDYIPVATYSRGLEKRVSNDRAIKQMGFSGWNEWREEQFLSLEKIMSKNNIKRDFMNNTERHRTVSGYKQEQRLIDNRMAAIDQNLSKSRIEPKKTLLGKETVDYEQYRILEMENNLLKAENSSLKGQNFNLEQNIVKLKTKPYRRENDRLTEEKEALGEKISKLKEENTKLKHENELAEKHFDNFARDMDYKINSLKLEKNKLDQENTELKKQLFSYKLFKEFVEFLGLGKVYRAFADMKRQMYRNPLEKDQASLNIERKAFATLFDKTAVGSFHKEFLSKKGYARIFEREKSYNRNRGRGL